MSASIRQVRLTARIAADPPPVSDIGEVIQQRGRDAPVAIVIVRSQHQVRVAKAATRFTTDSSMNP